MPFITVHISSQQLILHDGDQQYCYPISSAKKGTGQQNGSWQTPLGRHIIRAKIGSGCPINAVFTGRRFTGEIYSPALQQQYPERKDWILTRILWLSGLEVGINRLGNVDTMRRFVYIHGTPDSVILGRPGSLGCLRMNNHDMLDLYQRVPAGTEITILPN